LFFVNHVSLHFQRKGLKIATIHQFRPPISTIVTAELPLLKNPLASVVALKKFPHVRFEANVTSRVRPIGASGELLEHWI
jgi:hypothetical protein